MLYLALLIGHVAFQVGLVRILVGLGLGFLLAGGSSRAEGAEDLNLGLGFFLRVLLLDLAHLVDIGLDQVIGILFEEVIDGVVGPILIVLIVGDQDRGPLGDIFGLLKVEKGLNPVGYKVLRVEDVIETLGRLQTLLSDKVLFVVDAHEDTQRGPY